MLGGGAAPQRRSACRPHLLASVSSDEDRYVNPFAAGKWRAGPEQRPRSRDAAQEAEAGGGADPGQLVGAPARARGWRDRGGGASPAAFPSAPPRRLRVASVLAGLLVCALGLLDSFELGILGEVFLKKPSCSDECVLTMQRKGKQEVRMLVLFTTADN